MVRHQFSTATEVDPEEQIEVRIGKQVAQEDSSSCGLHCLLNVFRVLRGILESMENSNPYAPR